MTARRTLADIYKESADNMRPSNYYVMREESAPLRLDASTDPWQVSQDVNPPPPVHAGSREGFSRLTFFTNASRGREALKCALPAKIW